MRTLARRGQRRRARARRARSDPYLIPSTRSSTHGLPTFSTTLPTGTAVWRESETAGISICSRGIGCAKPVLAVASVSCITTSAEAEEALGLVTASFDGVPPGWRLRRTDPPASAASLELPAELFSASAFESSATRLTKGSLGIIHGLPSDERIHSVAHRRDEVAQVIQRPSSLFCQDLTKIYNP